MSTPGSERVCRQYGQPEAHAVGEEILCAACLHARGSCGAVRDITETDQPPAGNEGRLSV